MAEHGIKSLASILMKHLTGLGENWPLYCKPAMLAYNSYATPNLDNLSPFEIAIDRKALLAPNFECKPRVPITGAHVQAKEKLQERLLYFRKRLEEFRSNRIAVMNKDRQHYGYTVGQIVYMYNPSGSQLQTGSRKIQCHFVGSQAIYKCISPNQFLLMSLDGVLYPVVVEEAWLKPGLVEDMVNSQKVGDQKWNFSPKIQMTFTTFILMLHKLHYPLLDMAYQS